MRAAAVTTMRKRRFLGSLIVAASLFLTSLPASGAELSLTVGDEMGRETVGTHEQKSFSLRIHNGSAEGVSGIRAVLLAAPEGISILDGEVTAGSVEANHYILPDDLFTLSVETGRWSPMTAVTLQWRLEYTDPSGLQQRVVETVSTF